jgi:hypothetical protein
MESELDFLFPATNHYSIQIFNALENLHILEVRIEPDT